MKRWGALAALAFLAIAGVTTLNLAIVSLPVRGALAQDFRNARFAMWAHFSYLLSINDLVLDLREATGETAMIDIDRGLFTAAAALRDRKFDLVYLAWRGETRFILKGEDFQHLGVAHFLGENPVYLLRTLPEKLYGADGRPAFATWTGGWLGVMNKQMEDHEAFHRRWWISR